MAVVQTTSVLRNGNECQNFVSDDLRVDKQLAEPNRPPGARLPFFQAFTACIVHTRLVSKGQQTRFWDPHPLMYPDTGLGCLAIGGHLGNAEFRDEVLITLSSYRSTGLQELKAICASEVPSGKFRIPDYSKGRSLTTGFRCHGL